MLARMLGFLSDVAVYGVTGLLGQIVGFLLLPLYTRVLDPKDYGIIGMLTIVTMLFGPFATLGMTTAIYRRLNQTKDEAAARVVLGTGLISVILASLGSLAICLVFADWIAKDFVGDESTTTLVQLTVFSATLAQIAQVSIATLRARRKVKTTSALTLGSLVFSITTTIVLVAYLRMGVMGWVLGSLASDALYLVAALGCTWRSFDLRINPAVWKSMLSYGLPLVPHRLQAVALGQFSQFMVREMMGLDEAGIYGVAGRFALPVGLAVNVIQEAWIPYKFQVHSQESDPRPFFRSMFTYYFVAISYLWVGVSLWSFDVVRLMTHNPAFHAAAYLVPMLALLRAVQGIYFMLSTGVELSDRTGAYPLISLAGLATVVAGAYVLVQPLGSLGAALANVLCWLVMAGVVYVLAQRRLTISYDWPIIGCFILLSAGCVGGGYATQNLPLAARLSYNVVVSLAYPVLAVLVLTHSATERERMHLLLAKFGFSGGNA